MTPSPEDPLTQPRFTRPIPFEFDIRRGLVPGHRPVPVVGIAEGIGTSFVDIWSPATIKTWPTAPAQVSVKSTSADDATSGVGARLVAVIGLDANWVEKTEVVQLNGATPVLTPSQFIRVNRIAVASTGTNGFNAGGIEASIGVNLQAHIPPGWNTSHSIHYTVPDGHTLFLASFSPFFSGKTSKDASISLRSWVRENLPGGITRLSFKGPFQDMAPLEFKYAGAFRERSDFWMDVKATQNDTDVTVVVVFILVENQYVHQNVSGETV